MGRALPRGVHGDATTRVAEGGPGHFDRQIGLVALLAQMEQDQMTQGTPFERASTASTSSAPCLFERCP